MRKSGMALVGYARVSSVGQSLEVQLDKLRSCDKIFQEKKSGASDARSTLPTCLEYVRAGDTLVVTRLDRLARSTLHLCQVVADRARQQVHLQVLDQHLDTSDATGRLVFHLLGAMAPFETELRAERQMDGMRKARERGVDFGRKRKLTMPQVTHLRHRRMQGALINTLMKDYGLSKASVYRSLVRPPPRQPRLCDPWNRPFRGVMQKSPLPGSPAQRITSVAWKRTDGGMVRPSTSAVLRLSTSSNLVGCSTGRSAGLRPFRILST